MLDTVDNDVFNEDREFLFLRSSRNWRRHLGHSVRQREPQMPVRGSGGGGKIDQSVVDLQPIRASVDRRRQPLAPSCSPVRQALFVNESNSSVSGEPQAVVRIVEDRKNLIRWQSLLRANRA